MCPVLASKYISTTVKGVGKEMIVNDYDRELKISLDIS
jgi:hypothetical protein